MIDSNDKLLIFENFIVDQNLKPKKASKQSSNVFDGETDSDGDGVPQSFTISNSTIVNGNGMWEINTNLEVVNDFYYKYLQNKTIFNWIRFKFAQKFLNKPIKKPVVQYQSIEDFFNEIHTSVKDLKLEEKSMDFYIETIKNSLDNGQVALAEILLTKKNTLLKELNLCGKFGSVKYVDEADIVKSYIKSTSGNNLKLTWIKNFVRIIPQDVIEAKKLFDAEYVFDNYVVLHFDHDDSSTSMTKKEIEQAKDPILFGVIEGSHKLYFVGDWIDEECDLTLEKLLETLERKKAKEISTKSLKREFGQETKKASK